MAVLCSFVVCFIIPSSFFAWRRLSFVIVAFPGNIDLYMIQRMTKPTKLHVRRAKTQISLGIRPG